MLIGSVVKLKPRNFWNTNQEYWRHDRNVDKDRMTLDSLHVADYAPKDSRGKIRGDAEWRGVDWNVVTKVSKAPSWRYPWSTLVWDCTVPRNFGTYIPI